MYETSDLYLTAYLRAKGYDIKDIKFGSKCKFTFDKSDEMTKDVQNYINEKGSIEPIKLINAIKNIKSLTHSR